MSKLDFKGKNGKLFKFGYMEERIRQFWKFREYSRWKVYNFILFISKEIGFVFNGFLIFGV